MVNTLVRNTRLLVTLTSGCLVLAMAVPVASSALAHSVAPSGSTNFTADPANHRCGPPALSYGWGDTGVLLPLQSLNTHTAPPPVPPGPVGNPIGGKTFTLWQPGVASQGFYLTPQGSNNGTGPTSEATYVPGLNLWYSNFAVWSPDGEYLITPAYYGGRLFLPGQPTPAPMTFS